MISREPIMRALKQKLRDNLPDFPIISRRFRMPDAVGTGEFPAVFIVEPGEMQVQTTEGMPSEATIDVSLYLYIDAGDDPNSEPISALNITIDRVAAALSPDFPPPYPQVCTLGGLVQHCWIEGTLEKDPGDLDGTGMARIPVRILVP